MPDDHKTISAITRLETQMEGISTHVVDLKETMKEGFDKLHTHVDDQMSHMKANIMQVVNTKADDREIQLRLESLEVDVARKVDAQRIDDLKAASDIRARDLHDAINRKTDAKEFTFIKSIVLGACALILVGFMGAMTAIVFEAKAGKTHRAPVPAISTR